MVHLWVVSYTRNSVASKESSSPGVYSENMEYQTGKMMLLRAGIPYWDKVPMNITEGFDWKIAQEDMVVFLVRKHDTTPITIWQAIAKDDGTKTGGFRNSFFFSEPLMDQFIHEFHTQEMDSAHGSL
jgi:hypothetical protein